jgi:hypothetical protein
MRKLAPILFCWVLVLHSCSKDASIHDGIYGPWQWEMSRGGITGGKLEPPANTRIVLNLGKDMIYSVEKNDVVIQKGKYSFTNANSISVLVLDDYNTPVDKLYLNKYTTITFKDNKLMLYDYYMSDGYNHIFK